MLTMFTMLTWRRCPMLTNACLVCSSTPATSSPFACINSTINIFPNVSLSPAGQAGQTQTRSCRPPPGWPGCKHQGPLGQKPLQLQLFSPAVTPWLWGFLISEPKSTGFAKHIGNISPRTLCLWANSSQCFVSALVRQ